MVEATRNEGFLDSIRRRAQEWIEDRPFLRQINRDLKEMAERTHKNWDASPEADKADIDRRLDAYIASTEGQTAAELVKRWRSDIDEPFIIAELGPEVLKNPTAVKMLGGEEEITKTIKAAEDYVRREQAEEKVIQDNIRGGLDNPASGMTIAHKSEWVSQDGVYEERTLVGRAPDGKFYLQNESTHTSGEGPIDRSSIDGPFASVREALGHNIDAELAHYKVAPTEQAERAYMAEVDAMRASGRLYERDPALDAAEARADVMGDASISGRMEFEDPSKSLDGVRQAARDAAGIPGEEQRAAQSWRKDAGESYMAELASRSESNVDRRQMEMWATKQEQNRAAWDVASPVTHERQQETQANTMTLKP